MQLEESRDGTSDPTQQENHAPPIESTDNREHCEQKHDSR